MINTLSDLSFGTPSATQWPFHYELSKQKFRQHPFTLSDDTIHRIANPVSQDSLPSESFVSTMDTCMYPANGYFGRSTALLPSPPSTHSSNTSLVADFGFPGPSPRDENGDLIADTRLKIHPYLPPQGPSQSFWSSDKVPVINGQQDNASVNISCNTISGLLSLTNAAMEDMTPHHLQLYLESAVDTIRGLTLHLQVSQCELNKQLHCISRLQSLLSAKDQELKAARQQLAMIAPENDTSLTKCDVAENGRELKMAIPNKKDGASTRDKEQCQRQTEKKDRDRRTDGKQVWKRVSGENGQSSAETTTVAGEYRLSVGKHSAADWQTLIDRIIHHGDQQASIFIQQKLKSATAEQNEPIFKAIVKEGYALMTSRFGNFLVQRFLDVTNAYYLDLLVSTMRGRIVSLTCHPFGSHVLQKVFCHVDQDTRAAMVQELCTAIPETIMHKHACHIWQKVFEMQWRMQVPPPVMDHVNAALKGQWARVALDKTGSLVIQHIFENLSEQEKRPILDEVLESVIPISKGQWGNWVIQHILEHADSNADRERVFQVVLDHAVLLSTDQFSSKVVEKAFRTGGAVFLSKFTDKVMTALPQPTSASSLRPREILVDMASDQYGNYVVQWLINHTPIDDQVKICRLIKRHMVSLRGSKYGQRVAYLVEKILEHQDIATYPAGASLSRACS